MNGNWLKPLNEIVEMATPWFTERGHVLTDSTGMSLAEQFYMGRNRKYAARKIQVALGKSVGAVKYQQWQEKTEQFREMEQVLRGEGWVWRADISRPDAGVWEHAGLRLSVNQCGGTFPSREEATWRTFHSQLRKTINGEE